MSARGYRAPAIGVAAAANQAISAIFVELPVDTEAPRQARRLVLGRLGGHVNASTASDVELIVSELVTNNVLHTRTGSDQLLNVAVEMKADRLRITVTNSGADHRCTPPASDPAVPGGLGLRLLEAISTAWGVVDRGAATNGVWCDLLLNPSPAS